MATTIDIQGALEKAHVKRDVAKRLIGLPVRDQRDVLIDLLAALEESPDPVVKRPAPPTLTGKQAQLLPNESAPDETEGGLPGPREALIGALRAKPGSPIKELAMTIYGDATSSHVNSVRANLSALGKQGRLRNTGFGLWEVVTKP